jgi:hypothetical protein
MLPVLILLALPVLIEVFSRRAAPEESEAEAVPSPAE